MFVVNYSFSTTPHTFCYSKNNRNTPEKDNPKHMKAVNLFAGTGTLTRAFQNQGVEVIWAQGESEDEAQIHRCNFPDIPFYLGELSHAADKIPSHDILLASLSCGPFSISVNRAYQDKSREQLYFVDSLLSKHQPRAVCFMFPA